MANPFITDFKSWVLDDLADPSFTKRVTTDRLMREMRTAHTRVFERLLSVSGEQSQLGYTETILTIKPDVEFYRLPGNFRSFEFLERRTDLNDPSTSIGRIPTRARHDRSMGIKINSQLRGFKIYPRPILNSNQDYVFGYQAAPIRMHYGTATAYANPGVPKIRSIEEITVSSWTAAESAAAPVTESVTDGVTSTGGISALTSTRALKIEFTGDPTNLAAGDIVKVYFTGMTTSNDWSLLAGTADTTVTSSDRIDSAANSGDGWITFTLTAALISQIVTYGDGEFCLRVAPNSGASLEGRAREVETTIAFSKLKSSLTLPTTIDAAQGELVLVDEYYTGSVFRIYSASAGVEQTNVCTHFNGATRVATFLYDWSPPLAGTVSYEILPVIPDPYSRLISMAASISILPSRRDFQGRKTLISEYREMWNAAKRFLSSTDSTRPPTMVDTEPGSDDPYVLSNIY